MATKRITELSLRSDFSATCNVPVDDTIQTYRCTGAQILEFIQKANGLVEAKSADYTITDTDSVGVILMTTGGSNRTVTLPDATAAANARRRLTIKKVDSGTGFCTVDGNSTQTIDGALTFVLYSQWDYVTLVCDGANWVVVDENLSGQTVGYSDTKAPSDDGGSSTASSWTDRVLNTTTNPLSLGWASSPSSNSFTLQPGTYRISGSAPFYRSERCKLRLQNDSDGTTAVYGQSGYSASADAVVTSVPINGTFTITAAKTFSLDYWVTNAQTTNGLGVNIGASGQNEVYANITIERLR